MTAALFFFVYNLMIGCSKKNRENYQPENAFEQKKKKPRLKFNPGLAVIGLWTTGPRRLVIALPAHPRHQSLAFFRLRRLDTRSHPCLPGSGEEKVSTLNCSKKPRNRLKIFRGLCSIILPTGRSFLIVPDRRRAFWPLRKGDVTRDDSQRRFLAQHSVATLLQHCFEWSQHCSNIAKLCCAKNCRCESSRVKSP